MSDLESDHSTERPPPLPPRPTAPSSPESRPTTSLGNLRIPKTSRHQLLPQPTTAIQLTDIQTQGFRDGARETFASPAPDTQSVKHAASLSNLSHAESHKSDAGDTNSVLSYAATQDGDGDLEGILGDILSTGQGSPAANLFGSRLERAHLDEMSNITSETLDDFEQEFEELDDLDHDRANEGTLLNAWKSKRKQFIILSAAGKPIYNRHGDDNLISPYIGIIQTIISFYEEEHGQLRAFTAGKARFVILSEGPLYLVAISRLRESDAQLRLQLEALYMQILSTLTLPTLTRIFSNKPSTDLRRPLQGTEVLLSALADTFTRGSAPALLSSLECLKLPKSHRSAINNILLKARADSLLYGLIVAGGRLVSVIRPKRHSLHPGDLQLIFNMLFEADGVKAAGGENWIPLCLPGFNNQGFLYMYVSFIDLSEDSTAAQQQSTPNSIGRSASGKEDEIAIILVSAGRESFFEMRTMRDEVVSQLESSGNMSILKNAVRPGRLTITDIVPGTALRHFLYKSRRNVQFVMPSFNPHYPTLISQRKLLSLYSTLHAAVHAKNAHVKVHHCISKPATSLAWVTPQFELYCVAGPNVAKNALAQSANQVVQWVTREQERIFIIGGAVF
ncbi:MAG: Vacuolar fusion protein mon1 [Cirrosporium novae-zelandiae]|nr:MAG: Vacuolar fusion protein mon1 [Cirrosporium novae-zelandiae]